VDNVSIDRDKKTAVPGKPLSQISISQNHGKQEAKGVRVKLYVSTLPNLQKWDAAHTGFDELSLSASSPLPSIAGGGRTTLGPFQ
jgi:hypothetical protein